MSIRSDLVNEVLHQMRHGLGIWKALAVARRQKEIFAIYWHALSPDAQLLLINHIQEQIAKEATSGS